MKSDLRRSPLWGAPCFYCNVDSTELKIFVIAVIGSLVLGSVLSGVGLYLKGYFRNTEKVKFKIFEAEERE